MDTVIVLRFVERILAVSIGGISIYLGYRLFLNISQSADSEGKFTLPWNASIVLSRVGPGVFFALFGSAVVGMSLYRSIQYDEPNAGRAEVKGSTSITRANNRFVGATEIAPDTSAANDALNDARMLLRRDIAFLNNIPSQLDPRVKSRDQSAIEFAIHRIKLALMETVWGDWGDRAAIKDWIESTDGAVPTGIKKEAVEYYRYGMKVNP